MVVLIILSVLLAVMGVIILIGKGDNLIAGYNIASKEEREQYNIKRLRDLIASVLFVIAPMLLFLTGEHTMKDTLSFSAIVFILSIVVVILANTWAKKKGK